MAHSFPSSIKKKKKKKGKKKRRLLPDRRSKSRIRIYKFYIFVRVDLFYFFFFYYGALETKTNYFSIAISGLNFGGTKPYGKGMNAIVSPSIFEVDQKNILLAAISLVI